MHLTSQTDYALRCLIMLGLAAPDQLTIAQISDAYDISENHLVKIVGRLNKLGYVTTTRGKTGGVRLSVDPADLDLGALVREMEPDLGVVACLREEEVPCVIDGACRLRSVLQEATEQFIATLSAYTLADVLKARPKLERLLQLESRPRR